MKTYSIDRFCLLCSIILVWSNFLADGQKATISFNNAFNMLNSGSKDAGVKLTHTTGNLANFNGVAYTQKVVISYGIALEIVFEYAAVTNNLRSDIASDPETYNQSSGNVKKAMDNLVNGSFVKMSDYNSVNVNLNFQYNPAKLVVYGTDTGDYLNNTQSSPWDVGVYKAPNTAVSGTKIMVIKK